jgi:hypothetical protein
MGLIARILFGKKKVRQTKAEPTKTSIDFTVNDCNNIITQYELSGSSFHLIIDRILHLIKSGLCKIHISDYESRNEFYYKNEIIKIKYCSGRKPITSRPESERERLEYLNSSYTTLKIFNNDGLELITYILKKKEEGLINNALISASSQKRFEMEEELNAKRKEAEQSILKHL